MYHPLAPWAEKEKRFATLLVLSRLLSDEMSENHGIIENIGKGIHNLSNRIDLDGVFNEIDTELFFQIMNDLSSEGIISACGLNGYSIEDITKLNQKMANLNSVGITWDTMRKYYADDNSEENKKELVSIDLVTDSLSNFKEIFVVLDGRYEAPIRFDVMNSNGEEAAIKKLHNIAYIVNVPGKKVDYCAGSADNINNGLFKKRQINDYMKSNDLEKPTLVQKSKGENILVLKNEVLIKTMLINAVPQQYRSLYLNKTK